MTFFLCLFFSAIAFAQKPSKEQMTLNTGAGSLNGTGIFKLKKNDRS